MPDVLSYPILESEGAVLYMSCNAMSAGAESETVNFQVAIPAWFPIGIQS